MAKLDSRLRQALHAGAEEGCQIQTSLEKTFDKASGVWFAACGSTGIGIEAALADLSLSYVRVLSSAPDLKRRLRHSVGQPLVVGISISGLSVEVHKILDLASQLGLPTLYITSGKSLKERSHRHIPIRLKCDGQRMLPAAIYTYVMGCFGEEWIERTRPLSPPNVSLTPLKSFFTKTYREGYLPIIASADRPYLGRLFTTQYMEFLKRPAVDIRFPDWTHNLLWTLKTGHERRLAFLHIRPEADLEDNRFQKTMQHLTARNICQVAVDDAGASTSSADGETLMQVLSFYEELAARLGIDPHTEASFDSSESGDPCQRQAR